MSAYFHARPPSRRVNRPGLERRRGAPRVPPPRQEKGLYEDFNDEDFKVMSDPDFLAERRHVREELEQTPEHQVSPELAARHQQLNEEFLRRASLAWTLTANG